MSYPENKPHWHKDAKWVSAILLLAVFQALLAVHGYVTIASQEQSSPVISIAVAAAINPSGSATDVLPWLSAGNLAIAEILRIVLTVLALLLFSALVYWSARLGRLLAPGIVMILASAPGALLFGSLLITILNVENNFALDPEAALFVERILMIVKEIGPGIVSVFLIPHLVALALGIALVLAAGIGRVVIRIRRKRIPLPAEIQT